MFSSEEIQSFNELEMSIYNYIIHNKQKVAYMKIRELAAESHVSTTTILRFCQKTGCQGYSEFKLRLKQYLQDHLEKQPDMDVCVIRDYFQRVETEGYQSALEKALEILTKSKSIVFIGTGTSGVMGKYGARYFNNVGWFSLCIDDPFTPVYRGESETTVVIALSVSGTTEQTIQLANQLKNRGCPLISITNSANCTLAQMSDCNIAYYIPDIRIERFYDLTSQIPVVFTIETLGRRLRGRSETKPETQKNRPKI